MNTMNILDFSKSISYDDLERDLHSFFDENLILYRLMGGVSGVNISSESPNRALYRITITDANITTEHITQHLRNAVMSMYDTIYKVNVTCDGKDILVTFDKIPIEN